MYEHFVLLLFSIFSNEEVPAVITDIFERELEEQYVYVVCILLLHGRALNSRSNLSFVRKGMFICINDFVRDMSVCQQKSTSMN